MIWISSPRTPRGDPGPDQMHGWRNSMPRGENALRRRVLGNEVSIYIGYGCGDVAVLFSRSDWDMYSVIKQIKNNRLCCTEEFKITSEARISDARLVRGACRRTGGLPEQILTRAVVRSLFSLSSRDRRGALEATRSMEWRLSIIVLRRLWLEIERGKCRAFLTVASTSPNMSVGAVRDI